MQIAVADPAIDAIVAIGETAPAKFSRYAVRRRVRQGDAGQVIEFGQIASADRERGVEVGEIERPMDIADGGRPGGPCRHGGVERIGFVRVDVEQRAADNVHVERLAVQRAVALQPKALDGAAVLLLAR